MTMQQTGSATAVAEPRKPFEITGKHVLFAMIGFFGAIIAVNIVFVKLAVGSFPGEEVEKSYYQGLNYNDTLAEKERQAETGWRMQLVEMPRAGERAFVEVKLLKRDGTPVYHATLRGVLSRPTTDIGRQALEFYPMRDGVYRSDLANIAAGAWDLSLEAMGSEDETVELAATTRITVE